MGTDERLVIKHLSKHGELLDCVNCFPGKITVLRAESESDLIPYRQAVAGLVSGQKFSITYNNQPFDQKDHIVIGFGPILPPEKTVSGILIERGISPEQIVVILKAFGLEGTEKQTPNMLSADFCRRLEILWAIYSNCRVLVLDSPFECISSMWKDKFADLILEDVSVKKRITLVSRLCYRPTNWIGNDAIDRQQVGSSVQKTIGFGSKATELNKIVAELRKSGAISQTEGVAPLEMPEIRPPMPFGASAAMQRPVGKQSWQNYLDTLVARWESLPGNQQRILTIGTGVCAALLVTISVFAGSRSEQVATQSVVPTPKVEVVAAQKFVSPAPQIQISKNIPDDVVKNKTQVAELPKPEVAKVQVAKLPPPTILDSFGPDIKRAVVEAFNERDDGPGIVKASATAKTKSALDNPFDALRNLKPSKENGSSSSYESPTYSSAPSSYGSVEMDPDVRERQEEIRRRFLEALQRASSQEQ